ncbi:DUF1304 domain-containing protein [Demequina sp. NBRC 110056]|uniref:DUF1304 domain-containing protein n=1 Tax=Demequina sp. NBRC 110056 TaxID=1570345 RepID=UPI000A06DF12|nr:DUF1304 domain-containing protein [Demequina sp. NBRC 110056]
MDWLVVVFASLAALLHVGFFVLEAVLWKRPAVHRIFGARTPEQAELLSPAFFNLGFYNLFLGIGTGVGVWLWLDRGQVALLVFGLLFMVGAAQVLRSRSPRMWRGTLIQGVAPLLALLILAIESF